MSKRQNAGVDCGKNYEAYVSSDMSAVTNSPAINKLIPGAGIKGGGIQTKTDFPSPIPAVFLSPKSKSNRISAKALPPIPITVFPDKIFFTPFADEFWQYYYHENHIHDPETYLGGEDAPAKLMGLCLELRALYLNEQRIDPSLPVIENQNTGHIVYVGDTHGSIQDTDRIIQYCIKGIQVAQQTHTPFRVIFLGDYIDRNPMDIHNISYIYAFALKYPQHIRLLRGNHEEVGLNSVYGFMKNVQRYLGEKQSFIEFERTFLSLPLMHAVRARGKVIVALHGGIPIYEGNPEEIPEIPNLLAGLDRLDSKYARLDDMDSLSQQILWNDPAVDLPEGIFYLPSRRGTGFNYGEEVFNEWMWVNGADRLIRAHEVFLEGHQEFFHDQLFSIFSASDYGGKKIKAKIMDIDLKKPWDSNWEYLNIESDL